MVRRAKQVKAYYRNRGNLLLENTKNINNLHKIYRMLVYLGTIVYICCNINVTLQEQQQNSYYSQTKTKKTFIEFKHSQNSNELMYQH